MGSLFTDPGRMNRGSSRITSSPAGISLFANAPWPRLGIDRTVYGASNNGSVDNAGEWLNRRYHSPVM